MDIAVLVTAATIRVRHVTLVTAVRRAWRSRVVVVHTMPRRAAPSVPDTRKSHGLSIVEWRALKALLVEDGCNSGRPRKESGLPREAAMRRRCAVS
jgi:hypothetical protein